MFNPKFTYAHTMVSDLLSIEYSRAVVDFLPLSAPIERDLIEAAIATYQLLTIHPFEDGNG